MRAAAVAAGARVPGGGAQEEPDHAGHVQRRNERGPDEQGQPEAVKREEAAAAPALTHELQQVSTLGLGQPADADAGERQRAEAEEGDEETHVEAAGSEGEEGHEQRSRGHQKGDDQPLGHPFTRRGARRAPEDPGSSRHRPAPTRAA